MIDDLLRRIEREAPAIIGWCPLAKSYNLAMLIVALRPALVVEIGVWGGKSLIPMAMACGEMDKGRIVAIDPWNAAESQRGYVGANADWWGKVDHEQVYQGFIGHIERLGLRGVTVLRSPSDAVSPPPHIDLLHIDGQHSEQAIRDVERFASQVRIGGVVVADDLSWHNEGVQHVALAVEKLKELGFIELYRARAEEAEWGVFQRVG